MTPDQQALIAQWKQARDTLKQWEEYERVLRINVVNVMFGDYGEGLRTLDLGNGYGLTNQNITKHDVADTKAMRDLVNNFCAYGQTAEVGAKLIKPSKPSLSVRAYKSLPDWGRKMMDEHITTKPQLPQLTLILPK